jgi:predicted metal-dependent phosphoesterase TrpH
VNEVKMLFHVHTCESHDSVLKIETIIDFCNKSDIRVLAVTDHDSFCAIPRYMTLCAQSGITLIPGVEYTSNAGDIIGLFIKDFKPRNECNEILRDIREQGGLSIIPHPYSGHDLSALDFSLIDGIEVFNPRCSPQMNEEASNLARETNKLMFEGGDTHLKCELGLVVIKLRCPTEFPLAERELRKIICTGERSARTSYTSRRSLHRSQMIKGIKRTAPRIFIRSAIKYMFPNFRAKPIS